MRTRAPLARRARAVPLAALLAGGLLVAAPGQARRARPDPIAEARVSFLQDAELVGSDECGECHDDPDGPLAILRTPHLALFGDERSAAPAGCEACHGPASEHVISGDPDDITLLSELSPREASAPCLRCHSGDRARLDFRRSVHHLSQVRCTDCHRVHDPRSQPERDDACYSCHPEVRASFAQPHRHPVPEGVLGCVDCHPPHGGFRATIRRVQGATACASCHEEQAGPFVHEHASRLFGGCVACHDAHGSPHPHLLVRRDAASLCLECHVNTPSGHDLADGVHDQCLTCHVEIHGSNVAPTFLE